MKVNPAHIRSYQNMSLPSRAGQVNRSQQAPGKTENSARTNPGSKIDGADFTSYLSKAEKKFLVEKFFEAGEAKRKEPARTDTNLGSLLDIKA